MKDLFRDVEHLVRMAGLFVVGTLVFLGVRAAFMPADFGLYGHYRAGALDDNRAQQQRYAGRYLCEDCHDDVAEDRAGGAHARIGCEACHGPLLAHAEDPTEVVPERPEGGRVCVICHEASPSRPARFPQVDAEEHAMGDPCDDCHEPHRPGFDEE